MELKKSVLFLGSNSIPLLIGATLETLFAVLLIVWDFRLKSCTEYGLDELHLPDTHK